MIRCERVFTIEDGATEPYQCPETATVPVLVGDVWAHCCAACAKTYRRRTDPPLADFPALPAAVDAPPSRPPE